MTVNRFFELYNSTERIFQTEDIPNPPFIKIQEVNFGYESLEDVLKNEYQTESEIRKQGYFINDK